MFNGYKDFCIDKGYTTLYTCPIHISMHRHAWVNTRHQKLQPNTTTNKLYLNTDLQTMDLFNSVYIVFYTTI